MSTKTMYERVWNDFQNIFFSDILSSQESVLPISMSTLSLYLVFLHDKGYSASTIASYNSAIIRYYHKLGEFPDRTASFYITKLLQGAKRRCLSLVRIHEDSDYHVLTYTKESLYPGVIGDIYSLRRE